MQTENLQDTQVLYSNLIQNSISISSRLHLLRPTKTSSNETLFEKDNEIEDGQTKDKKKRKRKRVFDGVIWNQAGLYEQDALIFPGNVWPPSLSTLHLQQPKKNTRLNHLNANWFTPEGHNGFIRPSMVMRNGKKKWKRRPGVLVKANKGFVSRTRKGRDFERLLTLLGLTLKGWFILLWILIHLGRTDVCHPIHFH